MPKLITFSLLSLSLAFIFFLTLTNASTYYVTSFGARSDGQSDSTRAFLNAWQAACGSAMASTIIVPDGWFLVTPVVFRGPCKNRITLLIHGTILAPSRVHHGLGNSGHWILFSDVNGVEIHGGTLDARGAAFWDCRRSGDDCPVGKRVCSCHS
ncbi:polygalacturonase-like [Carica papaya]|uniref:polygalacturonase-like n=1 Tax=Carica papaya TaxID=3649 RepID=UPI000B8D1544|nr:polygalacturonase-like [Carica papaya]